MTGRRLIAYVPGAIGARTWNVNVPTAPGGTLASFWNATRFADGQPTPSPAHVSLSRFTPSRASWPSSPFVQVCEPVFRKLIDSVPLTWPGRSVGYGDCVIQRL